MPADEYIAAQYGLGFSTSPASVEGFVTDACGIPLGTWSNIETAPPLTLERLREGMQALERLRDEFQAWPDLADTDHWVMPEETLVSPASRAALSEAGFAQAQQEMASWDGVPCPCTLCESGQGADNVTDELVALVRQGDEAGFRELAGCVMPAGEIDECWAGARARLGLPGPSVPSAVQDIAEGLGRPPCQDLPFYGRSIVEMLGEGARSDRDMGGDIHGDNRRPARGGGGHRSDGAGLWGSGG